MATNYDRGDVVTIIGHIMGDNARTCAEALNINAKILKNVLDRLEKLEGATAKENLVVTDPEVEKGARG